MSSELWLGYVVEDDMLEPTKHKEEAKMDKPRICQVLGVEVEEHFSYNERPDIDIWFCGTGSWCCSKRNKDIDIPFYILACINHPDRIIRKPRWTEQDVEDAKTVRRVFGRDGVIRRTPNLGERSALVFDHLYINEDLFPSIKPGQSVTLDQIIGGAE